VIIIRLDDIPGVLREDSWLVIINIINDFHQRLALDFGFPTRFSGLPINLIFIVIRGLDDILGIPWEESWQVIINVLNVFYGSLLVGFWGWYVPRLPSCSLAYRCFLFRSLSGNILIIITLNDIPGILGENTRVSIFFNIFN
jgi:hypothetical protein